MQDVVSKPSQGTLGMVQRFSIFAARVRSEAPSLADCAIALVSAALLIISFPDFNLWPLAWIGLVPLFIAVARKPQSWRCLYLGWLFGSVFFYGSCYWLTYSMIHTGGISPWVAFPLLLPGAVLLGIFPGVFFLLLARAIRRWGNTALFLGPLIWPTLEWARLEITGQLWNAIGYSQAYHPWLIQSARWGGVYAVGALVVLANAAIAFAFLQFSKRNLVVSGAAILLVVAVLALAPVTVLRPRESITTEEGNAVVVAIQPNVPMDLVKPTDEMQQLTARHFEMTQSALQQLPNDGKPRLVIWPESPMNFTYGSDNPLREKLAAFAKANKTSVLLNSQEVAPNDGIYNSALLINEEGSLVSQYDKIRLLPFGEYVPLPQWLPGRV